jgi:diphthine synthase
LRELIFIGLGLHDENGLSLRGQTEARSCDLLFAEFYTSVMPGLSLKNLEKIVGKPVRVLSRAEVEERAEQTILSKTRVGKVGFLVPGDPMIATTHVDLRLRACKTGIRTSIVHAASVGSAVAGATGLQSYKFGRTVTIPVSWQGEFPESVHLAIQSNLSMGLHSLVLLEVDIENKRHITIPEALRQLKALKQISGSSIGADTFVVGIARLEAPDMKIKAGTISELEQIDFGDPPYAMIFPSRLHFVEAEALQLLCGARKELVAMGP